VINKERYPAITIITSSLFRMPTDTITVMMNMSYSDSMPSTFYIAIILYQIVEMNHQTKNQHLPPHPQFIRFNLRQAVIGK